MHEDPKPEEVDTSCDWTVEGDPSSDDSREWWVMLLCRLVADVEGCSQRLDADSKSENSESRLALA